MSAGPRSAELRARALELLGAVEDERGTAGVLRGATDRWGRALEALAGGPAPDGHEAEELARLHALLRATVEARLLDAGRLLDRVRGTRRAFREHVGRLAGGDVCDVTG